MFGRWARRTEVYDQMTREQQAAADWFMWVCLVGGAVLGVLAVLLVTGAWG